MFRVNYTDTFTETVKSIISQANTAFSVLHSLTHNPFKISFTDHIPCLEAAPLKHKPATPNEKLVSRTFPKTDKQRHRVTFMHLPPRSRTRRDFLGTKSQEPRPRGGPPRSPPHAAGGRGEAPLPGRRRRRTQCLRDGLPAASARGPLSPGGWGLAGSVVSSLTLNITVRQVRHPR